MANHLEAIQIGGPVLPAKPAAVTPSKIRRRLFIDRLASRLVTLGGMVIIASILAILLVIVAEIYPFFKKPVATPAGTVTGRFDSAPLALGLDEYRELAYLVTASGVQFISTKDGTAVSTAPLAGLNGAAIVGTSALGRGGFAAGLSDGRVLPLEVKFAMSYLDGTRRIEPDVIMAEPIVVDPDGRPIKMLAYVTAPSGPIAAAVIGPQELMIITIKERKALIGPSVKQEARQRLALTLDGEITALILDGRGEDLLVGTSAGQLARIDLRDAAMPKVADTVQATGQPGIGISTVGFLIGDRTIIVGDTAGAVSSWQLLRDQRGVFRLRKIYDFAPHTGPVSVVAPSQRDKGFITADTAGTAYVHYGTTGATLLTVTSAGEGIRTVAFAPKADGFSMAKTTGQVSSWTLTNPHPEITLRSLFGKIWYEGYEQPEYVWQSTGGTDDFEAKVSLTPLIFGTLKGTFYAMLFAVPIALLSALYASQFM
ncbi:MAG TPA: ABC transporter permease, partial [Candidatus Tectomicrobia bacterium]